MNGLPYYKAYPRDFVEGTIGMPFEIKCAYRVVLDLIYMQGGLLPDDPRYISGLLGCSIRKWKSIREALVELGKIQVSGEFLTNKRAEKELETLAKLQDKQRENRSAGNKNNNLQKPRSNHTEPEPDIEERRDTNVSPRKPPAESHPDVLSAVYEYNIRCDGMNGWPQVQKITKARASAVLARLKDAGGMDGWMVALKKADASDFLTGKTGNPFSASFDWLTKPSNFIKLMEGNYDNRIGTSPTDDGRGMAGPSKSAEIADRAARYVASRPPVSRADWDA